MININTQKFQSKSTSKTLQVFDEGWDLLAKAKKLSVREKRGLLIPQLIRYLRKAERYQFNLLACEISRHLHYYYHHYEVNKSKAQKYGKKHRYYHQLKYDEGIVENRFTQLSGLLNNTRSPSKSLRIALDKACEDLRPYLRHDSALISSYIYTLLNARAHLHNQPEKIVAQCQTIIQVLEAQGIERTAHFYKDLTVALLHQGRYSEATTAIDKAIKNINKGSLSWSVFVYYRFILELRRKNYHEAYAVFQTADRKRQINQAIHEQWLIVRGYIAFLVRAGHIQGTDHFKFGKFLNEVPVFSKDKEGNNINILILQILLRIGKDHGALIDKKEAMGKYIERYLRKNIRARTFLKLLLKLPRYDFDPQLIRSRTHKEWQILETNSIQLVGLSDVEIVPYDDLWEMVLAML